MILKRAIQATAIVAVLAITSACEEQRKTEISLGFDFTKATSGYTYAEVSDNVEIVTVKAEFDLQEGILEALIIDPDGDTIVNKRYVSYGKEKIEEKIAAKAGDWYMGYSITDNDGLTPEGSFKMTIRY